MIPFDFCSYNVISAFLFRFPGQRSYS